MSNEEWTEWLDIDEAAKRAGRSSRQVRRYAERGRIRQRKRGVRVEYHSGDVDMLAAELPQDHTPRPQAPRVLPAGEMLSMVERLQSQLAESAAREGYLKAQLDQRPALVDQQLLMGQLAAVQAERDALAARLDAVQGSGRRTWILALVVIIGLLLIVAVLLLR